MTPVRVLFCAATLCGALAAQTPGDSTVAPNHDYTWAEIQRLDPAQFDRIYVGNYQDYGVSWSPTGNQIVALAVDEPFGIHILDLSNLRFRLNPQRIFVPVALVDKSRSPVLWTAKVETKPIHQGFPSWSRDPDLVGYGEFSADGTRSKIVLYHIAAKTYENLSFAELSLISGMEFSKNGDDLLAFGEKTLLVYDYVKKIIVARSPWDSPIDQASWLGGGAEIWVSSGGAEYKLAPFSTDHPGPDSYAPDANRPKSAQVSFDGRWISFLSEEPIGGYVQSR